MGMLNSLHRFFVPALSPAMFNVATDRCARSLLVPLMPRLGLPPIAAIAIGTLVGGLGQIAHPVAGAARGRASGTGRSSTSRDPDLREVLLLMGPGTLGLAAVQINVLVNTYLATSQRKGAVSWLQLRVPADVPADRPLRRVDRDGGASRHRRGTRAADDMRRRCGGRCRARSA